MDVTKEKLKFDKEGNAVYTLKIKDFYNKMKSWVSGKYIDSKHFKLQDVELFLRVYPNGEETTDKGYVSVYLKNATKKKLFTSFKFSIGRRVSTDDTTMEPRFGRGWAKFLQHSSLVNLKGDEQLKVVCTIMNLKYLETEGTFDTMENINEDKKKLNDFMKETNVKLAQLEAKYTASQEETNLKQLELKNLDTKGTFDTVESINEDKKRLNDLMKETSVKFAQLEAKYTVSQEESNVKFAQLEAKIDELEKGRKMKKPNCPVCYEEMSPNAKIAQCISGHLICWSCNEKMVKIDCPSCGQPVNGRAFGMESYLKYLFQE